MKEKLMKNKALLMEKKDKLAKKIAEKLPEKKERNGEKIKVLHVLTDRNIGGAGRLLLYYLK